MPLVLVDGRDALQLELVPGATASGSDHGVTVPAAMPTNITTKMTTTRCTRVQSGKCKCGLVVLLFVVAYVGFIVARRLTPNSAALERVSRGRLALSTHEHGLCASDGVTYNTSVEVRPRGVHAPTSTRVVIV